LAIFAVFCIDFSINAGLYSLFLLIDLANNIVVVQATNRALLVDTLPTAEQASANAWAARMLGIGSVAGFFMCVDVTDAFV
jgi:solute carrier family 45, member 1/2/4